MERIAKQIVKLVQSSNLDQNLSELHDLLLEIPVFSRLFRHFSHPSRLGVISKLTIT